MYIHTFITIHTYTHRHMQTHTHTHIYIYIYSYITTDTHLTIIVVRNKIRDPFSNPGQCSWHFIRTNNITKGMNPSVHPLIRVHYGTD